VSVGDRAWLWLARLALRRMGDDTAWWLFRTMRDGYERNPKLRGDGCLMRPRDLVGPVLVLGTILGGMALAAIVEILARLGG